MLPETAEALKRCPKCGQIKPLGGFHRNAAKEDGCASWCKRCVKTAGRAYRLAHPEQEKKRYRAYAARHRDEKQTRMRLWRALHAKALAAYQVAYHAVHPEYRRLYSAAYYDKYPERRIANNALAKGVAKGKIPKPGRCSICGKEARLHGHHPDYFKPLEVVWLCSSCHRLLHLKRPTPSDAAHR